MPLEAGSTQEARPIVTTPTNKSNTEVRKRRLRFITVLSPSLTLQLPCRLYICSKNSAAYADTSIFHRLRQAYYPWAFLLGFTSKQKSQISAPSMIVWVRVSWIFGL